MQQRNLINAFFFGKCPVCRKGSIFKYPALKLTQFFIMNPACQNCQANFEPEPGFYIGAMYISYVINIAILTFFGFVLFNCFQALSEVNYLILIAFTAIVLMPFIFRFSRILWLYWWGGLLHNPPKI